jgi:hypothetical protein
LTLNGTLVEDFSAVNRSLFKAHRDD